MQQASENCHLVRPTADFPSRWNKNTNNVMLQKTRNNYGTYKNGCHNARVIVCFSCGFYCFTSGLVSDLGSSATRSITEMNHNLFSRWSPEYWQTMGSLLGCFMSGVSLCYLGRRTSLQIVAVPVLILAFSSSFLSVAISNNSIWLMQVTTLQIFIQSISKSLYTIIPPIYILETVCWHPGSYSSRAPAILLGLTHLPLALTSWFASKHFFNLNIAYIVLMLVMLSVVTSIMLVLSPESPRWLLQAKNRVSQASKSIESLWSGNSIKYNINKEIEDMQQEMQGIVSACTPNGYVRPLLVSSCFLLLSQTVGYEAFHFYTSWAYKLGAVTTDSRILTASIRLIAVCLTTLVSLLHPGPKCTNIALLITTPILMLSSLTFGIFTYALEQGNVQINEFAMLPIVLIVSFEAMFWFGIGTYAIPVITLIMPPKSRPILLTIGVIIYQITSYFCNIFLPLMLSVLHPYGVFWFHAFLTGITLMYISLVIIPELKNVASCKKKEETSEIFF